MFDMSEENNTSANDFHRARRRAILEDITRRLTGKPAGLLSYDEVRRKLRAQIGSTRVLKDIPLDAIVGSVGRYTDFTRSYLPRRASDEMRWSRVQRAMDSMHGVPPIEAYQLGDAYFVLDGNHRVSVARQLGESHIQGYVTELVTRVPFGPNDSPDDLIVKAEYAEFLEQTELDTLRPGVDLRTSAPGYYHVLESQIEHERNHMTNEQGHEVSFPEAAAHWYDQVYLPVVQVIRNRGALRDFPGRTETDLYIWVSEQRETIAQALGWRVGPDPAIANLVNEHSPQPQRVAARLGSKLLGALTPDTLETGPAPGWWRRDLVARRESHLFDDIFVPVSGTPVGWFALEQALIVTQQEGGRLHGLHVVGTEEQRRSAAAQAVREEFNWRCTVAGVESNLAIEVGSVADIIIAQARWADLLVMNLAHPPANEPVARLKSGFRTIIQRSPCPILAVPPTLSYCQRVLLSYDGSRKAEEALFVSTYLASKWHVQLAVVTVEDREHNATQLLDRARQYLESHNVQAKYLVEHGPVPEALLRVAAEQKSDLIVMGGYSRQPVLEVIIGSTVDSMLRASQQPILICH